MQFSKIKEPRSPTEKPKAVPERTPPRPRRLSIENCSATKTEKAMNNEDRKGTPSIPTRSRRLSSEGQKYAKKDNLLIKLSDDAIKPQPIDAVSIPKYGQIQDAEAVTRPFGHFSCQQWWFHHDRGLSCHGSLEVLLVLPIRSELLEQMVEHKFLLFSYQSHLNRRYMPEMRFRI